MKQILSIAILTSLLFCISGCQAIGNIFKAGIWVGVLVVFAVVGIVLLVVAKAKK